MQHGPAVRGGGLDGRLPDGAALDADDAAGRVGDRRWPSRRCGRGRRRRGRGRRAGRRCGRCSAGRRAGRLGGRPDDGGRPRRRCGGTPRRRVAGRRRRSRAAGRRRTRGRRAGGRGRRSGRAGRRRRTVAGRARWSWGLLVRWVVIGGHTVPVGALGAGLRADLESDWEPLGPAQGTRPPVPMLRAVEVAVLGPVGGRPRRSGGRPGDAEAARAGGGAGAARGAGRSRSTRIVDLLWGDGPPPGVTATLQAYVSQLRRVLEPDRPRRAPATVLVTVAPGLRAAGARRGRRRAPLRAGRDGRAPPAAARTLLGPPPARPGGELDRRARERLDEALGRWRGHAVRRARGRRRGRGRARPARGAPRRGAGGPGRGRGWPWASTPPWPAELEALTAALPAARAAVGAARAGADPRRSAGRRARGAAPAARGARRGARDRAVGASCATCRRRCCAQDPALDWVAPDRRAPSRPRSRAARSPEPAAALPATGRRPAAAGAALADGGARGRARRCWRPPWPAAEAGRPAFAVLTGEPGIGKSRLAGGARGAGPGPRALRVLVGRCSQDDGAPPLWPWRAVLGGIGGASSPAERRPGGAEDEGAASSGPGSGSPGRSAPRPRARPTAGGARRPALGGHLDAAGAAAARRDRRATERLLVLATWRPHPEPTGALADVAEALARRHAVRLRAGRARRRAAVAEVVGRVSERPVSETQAGALRDRTDGNPFFLVEYARLAGGRADLDELLAEDDPPTAVSEVVARRLARLPDETVRGAAHRRGGRARVRHADAGRGERRRRGRPARRRRARRRSPGWSARTASTGSASRTRWSATRCCSSMSASRRARAARPGRPGCWPAAPAARPRWPGTGWPPGPAHAAEAWRAAAGRRPRSPAACTPTRSWSTCCARRWRRSSEDPGATARDRYDVLDGADRRLPLVRAAARPGAMRRGGHRRRPRSSTTPRPWRRAAIAATRACCGARRRRAAVNELVVDALRPQPRRAARRGRRAALPHPARAGQRAVERPRSLEERRALVDEGARDGPAPRRPAARAATPARSRFVALWVMPTARGAARAGHRGDGAGPALGRRAGLRGVGDAARGRARRAGPAPGDAWPRRTSPARRRDGCGSSYGELVLDSAELPWQAMAGRFERVRGARWSASARWPAGSPTTSARRRSPAR